nr:putative ribonuclease H-like domain-containing protein [Tanacetum cinerariifolium]
MDVKSAFLYGTIEEEVYVCQPLGSEDLDYPDKVYKVVKALYRLHQAPRAWYETLANYLLENGFQRGKIDQTLFVKKQKGLQLKQKDNGIFISQDKYVAEILRKFGRTDGKLASTPINTEKPLLKDHDVKRIFRYLKGKPHLGLWYPKDSPFNLVAYFDSDYDGASLDMKSTIEGCQFLGCRLISWQCKKQTVVATSSTEAKYVAAASCYAQVLWIQNQLLDYGYNFMHTMTYIDNSSTIGSMKNCSSFIYFRLSSSMLGKVKKKQFFHNFSPSCYLESLCSHINIYVAAGCWWQFPKFRYKGLSISEYLSIGTILSSTDTVCTLQVLCQEETPLLYSLVFGEGVVNDATSVVLFNAVQKINADTINGLTALHIFLNFLYLFTTRTLLGVR